MASCWGKQDSSHQMLLKHLPTSWLSNPCNAFQACMKLRDLLEVLQQELSYLVNFQSELSPVNAAGHLSLEQKHRLHLVNPEQRKVKSGKEELFPEEQV